MSGAIIVLLRGGAKAPVTTMTWQWQVSADGLSGWASATGAGATSATYTPAAGDAGQYLRVVQSATDDGGVTTATSNVLGPIAAASLVNFGLTTADLTTAKVTATDQHTRVAALVTTNLKVRLATAATIDAAPAAVTTSNQRV